MTLPVLVVGDVHGDLERLFRALQPYPAERWHTVFLGDLVDGGPFGVGALRYARDRPHTDVVLGNHEVAMLWALRDRSTMGSWLGIGGQQHDLEELARDPGLQEWLRSRPFLLRLADGTLAQHSDTDAYGMLLGQEATDDTDCVEAVNRRGGALLAEGHEEVLWELMSAYGVFRRHPQRLTAWLRRTGARRVVHGHTGHRCSWPESYHGGLAIDFDGGFSRYYGRARHRRGAPAGATVAPLPP